MSDSPLKVYHVKEYRKPGHRPQDMMYDYIICEECLKKDPTIKDGPFLQVLDAPKGYHADEDCYVHSRK